MRIVRKLRAGLAVRHLAVIVRDPRWRLTADSFRDYSRATPETGSANQACSVIGAGPGGYDRDSGVGMHARSSPSECPRRRCSRRSSAAMARWGCGRGFSPGIGSDRYFDPRAQLYLARVRLPSMARVRIRKLIGEAAIQLEFEPVGREARRCGVWAGRVAGRASTIRGCASECHPATNPVTPRTGRSAGAGSGAVQVRACTSGAHQQRQTALVQTHELA